MKQSRRFILRKEIFDGVKIFERNIIEDSRGMFSRLYCEEELEVYGWSSSVPQINYSESISVGAVRGLHYQNPPFCEKKLISCVKGKVWDVFVDLRSTSSTFLKWGSQLLSSENAASILIPEGFAHGFQVLEESTILVYAHSQSYNSNAESGISPLDPLINVKWPLPITQLSQRDRSSPFLDADFSGVIL